MRIDAKIAYFSMEFGLDERMPTYAGGLGMLAGDMLRSAADLGVPMVGVSLVHRRGYLHQALDAEGHQIESSSDWNPADRLEDLGICTHVMIRGRRVAVRAWHYRVEGSLGRPVPVILLDTDVEENDEPERRLTDALYGGDEGYRLSQEIVLGIGGVRVLRALGLNHIQTFHMNEGHSALLAVELMRECQETERPPMPLDRAIEAVRRRCVFTTHTPIASGHDVFGRKMSEDYLGDLAGLVFSAVGESSSSLNMSQLAMHLSRYVNGVSLKHGQVSRELFGDSRIESITNGVHAGIWSSPAIQALFDRYCSGWRELAEAIRQIAECPVSDILNAHDSAKRAFISAVEPLVGAPLYQHRFTIGFARRATLYKRADLLLADPKRLKAIAARYGSIQIVYAGKAHPRDFSGKEIIHRVVAAAKDLLPEVRLVYLPNYDMRLGRLMTAGVDLWLNSPMPPMEASGTSGMKAAINGIPSLSIRDGWWIEGCIDGVTGWSIGAGPDKIDRHDDGQSLLDRLERDILPIWYHRREDYGCIMRNAVAINGSVFNTHRMVQEYVARAYFAGQD